MSVIALLDGKETIVDAPLAPRETAATEREPATAMERVLVIQTGMEMPIAHVVLHWLVARIMEPSTV